MLERIFEGGGLTLTWDAVIDLVPWLDHGRGEFEDVVCSGSGIPSEDGGSGRRVVVDVGDGQGSSWTGFVNNDPLKDGIVIYSTGLNSTELLLHHDVENTISRCIKFPDVGKAIVGSPNTDRFTAG